MSFCNAYQVHLLELHAALLRPPVDAPRALKRENMTTNVVTSLRLQLNAICLVKITNFTYSAQQYGRCGFRKKRDGGKSLDILRHPNQACHSEREFDLTLTLVVTNTSKITVSSNVGPTRRKILVGRNR